MNTASEITMNFLYKADSSTIEALTMVLSSALQNPYSHSQTLALIKTLEEDGLVEQGNYNYRGRSSWPDYHLTDKGRDGVEEGYGALWDDAAFKLWLESSPVD